MRSLSIGFLLAVTLSSQTFQGTLRGRILDPAGNAVSGANVVIVEDATQVPRTTVTNEIGEYVFTTVKPTVYTLTAEAAGFKKLERKGVNRVWGVARAAVAPTLLLDEDGETLRFQLGQGEAVIMKVFTPVERGLWQTASHLGQFTHTQLVSASQTTNKKAVSSMLRKAQSAGVITTSGKLYQIKSSEHLVGNPGTSGTNAYLQ